MEFAPFITVLHVLTCLSRTDGLLLIQTGRDGNVSQLPNISLGHTVSSSRLSNRSVGHDGNSSSMILPQRLPEECRSCSKLQEGGAEESCSTMSSVCQCCKRVFEERTISICKGFAEPLGKKYNAKDTHQECLVVFSSAMEQRDESCDVPYEYKVATTGTTPKRFGDICDGSPPPGCVTNLCGYWGCNDALKKAEAGYRDLVHYKEVYDNHPCKSAERNSFRKHTSLEAARAERKAAEKTAEEKVVAEKEAAKKAAIANAAFTYENKQKAAAENKMHQMRAGEVTAAENVAAAKVALEYAIAEREASEKASKLRATSARLAGEEAAAAKVALEKATSERQEAEKAAGHKRQAEEEAAKHAGSQVADRKQAQAEDSRRTKKDAFEKAEDERAENEAYERALLEHEYEQKYELHRRRRSDVTLATPILPAQGVQRHIVTAKTSSAQGKMQSTGMGSLENRSHTRQDH